MRWLLAAGLAALPSLAAAQEAPELRFRPLAADAEARLAAADPDQLARIVRLVGLDDPGDPIEVVLAPEDSEPARHAPPWVAGFALGDMVVLFPSRSPRYPHDSLESVLFHEVAHVLIRRAAGGVPMPRWFNEGLATLAERAWHFEDRRQLAWALAREGPVEMRRVDVLLGGSRTEAAAGYAFAGAFVRHIMETHGDGAPALILELLARGRPFDAAFAAATGEPLHAAEERFHAELMSWERWVPLLTSPLVLWIAVTLLALYAIVIGRRRRAERRRRWDEEESASEDPGSPRRVPE